MELPSTNDEQIAQFQAEYQAAFNAGSQDELESAKLRWAGVGVLSAHAYVLAALPLLPKQTSATALDTEHTPHAALDPCMHGLQVHLGPGAQHVSHQPAARPGPSSSSLGERPADARPGQGAAVLPVRCVCVHGRGKEGPGSSGMLNPRLCGWVGSGSSSGMLDPWPNLHNLCFVGLAYSAPAPLQALPCRQAVLLVSTLEQAREESSGRACSQPTLTRPSPSVMLLLSCRMQWLSSRWGGAWTRAGHSPRCCRCAQIQGMQCSSTCVVAATTAVLVQPCHCIGTPWALLPQLQLQSLRLC